MKVSNVGIVGAGLMGSGIAQVAAVAGYNVILYDANARVMDDALFYIGQRLAGSARKGFISQDDSEDVLKRIRACDDIHALAKSDLVIEAVPERMELKKQVFAELSAICPEGVVFASNTSGLSITEIASATNRPELVAGMHFFHPAAMMQLVELVPGNQTSEETMDIIRAVCQRMGKEIIEVKESPLFVVNRILVPMLNEAIFVLQEGLATAADIDKGMRLGANHPLGPLALADMVGLDTLLATAETLFAETGDTKYRPPQLLRQMVRAGKLGRKTCIGFYIYSD
ncbi:3-hydroxyacyl-CoA dehydrogenase family protein [Alicyclobacillus fodiniaquatilis]|uniref:3-hydroxyacyl-CoA dehydrogenase family protein n=1 Tax=Alicyclobacillus fodiniaquatilis TaxID=1661150 RepID=A0ABW4JMQ9_9BACL